MLQQVSPLERVGDGFGDEVLAGHIADAIPFMQFVIKDTALPRNQSGRTPSIDPDNWLAVHNCGPASKALGYYLRSQGYNSQPISTLDNSHMLLRVETDRGNTHVDPTALQFLGRYGVGVVNRLPFKRDNVSGRLLPPERVLIFRPEDYQDVAGWMTAVVKRYWQTKQAILFTPDLMDISRGTLWRRRQAIGKPYADIEAGFASVYAPDNLQPYTARSRIDYAELHERWTNEPLTLVNQAG